MKQLQRKQIEQLDSYKELIETYHKSLNLMSSRGIKDLDSKIADALSYANYVADNFEKNNEILDVGSGVGLPAIVMAIALPEYKFTLVERRQKRGSFLMIVKSQLQLGNVQIVTGSVEGLSISPVSLITAQAVGSFVQLYCLTRHLHDSEICLLSRKGETWQNEQKQLDNMLTCSSKADATNLNSHGRLVALSLPGGIHCPSLASLTKKAG